MSSTTIVIPCFNEERRLKVSAFARHLCTEGGCRLLFVNDGSRDRTLDVLRGIEAAHPGRADVIDLPVNSGKAEAVRRGVRFALERGADYVGYWDADLATPLEAIPEFVRVLQRRRGVDVVIGSRIRMLGRAVHRQAKRAFLGNIFARAASWTLGVSVRDTQCGAKLFRATPWVAGAFERPFHTRWIFDVELLARLSQLASDHGGPPLADCVYELPLDEWRDVAGSKLRSRDFLRAPAELAAIYLRYLSPFRSAAPAATAFALPRVVIPLDEHRRERESVDPATDESRRAA
jgi:glycosyltransferase involved in cell wall biosynthesis